MSATTSAASVWRRVADRRVYQGGASSVDVRGGQLSGESLEVIDVTVRFGGLTALASVSLDVGPGEVVGIIGPNGAGKTTLFNVACWFVAPESGRVVYGGRDLPRHRPDRLAGLGISRTLQALGLWHGMTVLENVMAGATVRA